MPNTGIFDDINFAPFLAENANWTYFKDILGLCVTEGLPGRFLDVGCGLGLFVECCARYGIPCEGLEGSAFAVEHARSRGVALHQFDLVQGQPFPFEAAAFSVALYSQVIEHLPPPAALYTLREIYRCLQPRGILVLYTPSRYNRKERADPKHINLYTPTTMRHEVEMAGFAFRKFLNNWPRNIFTRTRLEYFVWRQVARFYRPDWLSQGASCIAEKQA
jgi:SAM-dependent methyltransferase